MIALKIVNTMNNIVVIIENVITPAIGMIGSFDFSSWTLGQIKIGSFINSIVNFAIVAFTIFLVIRFLNKMILKRDRGTQSDTNPIA